MTLLQYETGRDAPFETINWSKQAVDEASVKQTLESLARFLADYADPTAAVSLRAQNVDTQSRLYLNVENEPTLLINVGKDRGFASVAYALDKSGFDVSDTNQSEGVFYAQPRIEKDERSATKRFFSRLAFYGEDKNKAKYNGEYVFSVQPANDGWLKLTVSSEKGLDKSDQKALLKEVKRNLT